MKVGFQAFLSRNVITTTQAPEKTRAGFAKVKNNVENVFHMEEQLLPVLFQGGIQEILRCNPKAEPATDSGKAVRR